MAACVCVCFKKGLNQTHLVEYVTKSVNSLPWLSWTHLPNHEQILFNNKLPVKKNISCVYEECEFVKKGGNIKQEGNVPTEGDAIVSST